MFREEPFQENHETNSHRANQILGKWVELKLKPPSRIHKAYIKDTSQFLQYIENLNTSKGPFDANSTLLITRDIANFYPSCDIEKCLQAVEN